MSKLSTIRKQIAALEAQAARIAKDEMDSAIGKVKSLMSDFGLTIEHLTQSVAGKAASKKSKSAPKKSAAKNSAAAPKYADPKSGKTWSGFGRAPGWIAGAKSRDAFLVNKGAAPAAVDAPVTTTKKVASKKAAKVAVAPAKKASKAVAKKALPVAKKVATSAKKAAVGVKKAMPKKAAAAKKGTQKKSASKKVATPSQTRTTSSPAPAAA
jgi:DNA-binding protein H-NS